MDKRTAARVLPVQWDSKLISFNRVGIAQNWTTPVPTRGCPGRRGALGTRRGCVRRAADSHRTPKRGDTGCSASARPPSRVFAGGAPARQTSVGAGAPRWEFQRLFRRVGRGARTA